MGQRLDLQALLEELLGSQNVYFQPPSNIQMVYPAIVYERDDLETLFAGNVPYRFTTRYSVTYIDRDPDSVVPTKIAALPMCIFAQHFTASGLNHDVYTLYF